MPSSEMTEALLVSYIALLGLLTIRASHGTIADIFRTFALALPLGCCYLVSAGILSVALFGAWNAPFILLAPLSLCLWYNWRRLPRMRGFDVLRGLLVLGAYALMVMTCYRWNLTTMSYDSYYYVLLGGMFVNSAPFPAFADFFRSYPIFLVVIQGLLQFFGKDCAISIGPLFVACVLSYITFCCIQRLRGCGILAGILGISLLVVVPGALLSSYFLIHQIFYVHNHTVHGALMFLAVMEICLLAALHEEEDDGQRAHTLIIFALLGGVAFSRIEGPLIASFILVLLAETKKLTARRFVFGTLVLVAFQLIWALSVWKYRNLSGRVAQAGSFINHDQMFAMMAPPIVVSLAYLVSVARKSIWTWRYLVIFFLIGILIRHAVLRPEHHAETLTSMAYNLLVLVPWGFFWAIAALAACYALRSPRDLRDLYVGYIIVAYPLIVLALATFRTPYRQGWGDSGNRMMVHLVPFVTYLVLFRALEIVSKGRDRQSSDDDLRVDGVTLLTTNEH